MLRYLRRWGAEGCSPQPFGEVLVRQYLEEYYNMGSTRADSVILVCILEYVKNEDAAKVAAMTLAGLLTFVLRLDIPAT